ncbi:biotin/lipoyl-containing protein [Candidatus Phytoplasma sacchari]|uniref:Biotin/lipoyl-binding protein n=1 Tax=Candidatus Phytoplasma sacchari TaxID=2609813 RepID=A0ABY7M1L0_9MOLU|nr:biotin/lipoyl-containing protein [Candidatus Phytoplasma sacchari]WBL31539.1 biotin/lipoyl-binding protein [Candidatus Phytoplasma sacchari]
MSHLNKEEKKIIELKLHDLGEGIMQGTILRLRVEEGSIVKDGDVLLEILNDKFNTEISSDVDGVVKKILCKEQEIVHVGQTLLLIEKKEKQSK